MRHQGKITQWNDDKGYGFVEPHGGGNRAFVHIKAFERNGRRPQDGDVITYNAVQESGGRFKASAVRFARSVAGEPAHKRQRGSGGKTGAVVAAGFCAFVAGAVVLGTLPAALAGLYACASVVAFAAYAIDKSAARNNRWRTQESTLHLMGLVGGWPGAYLAQRLLRHKSSKAEFQSAFWITAALNAAATLYLLTETGKTWLQSLPWLAHGGIN
jgi:uncharacterized membrane protein YsdA (DUF1294 family)/cold shock CspA family protein